MIIIFIDGHCDSLKVALDNNLDMYNKKLEFNFSDAKIYSPCIQVCAAFVATEYDIGINRALNILEKYKNFTDDTILIKSKNNIEEVIQKGKIGILLSIENGKAIDDNLDNVDLLYSKGVRMMGVTWNHDNLLGCGALTENDLGLTEFGEKYIKKLDEKNIIIDISHCSEKTFWNICEKTTRTIVASHSCCKSICNHPRNLDDNQIKEIAKRNGIIGICLSSKFLNENNEADCNDIIKHIEYIINLVGIDYVGIGSDFDGVSAEHKLKDIKRIKDISILEERLKILGYDKDDIDKIMWRNWIRIIEKI